MVDFLVYNKVHWMDKLSLKEVQERIAENPRFEQSYNARYRKGDIVEAGPDGHWEDSQTAGGKFIIVHCPHIPFEDAKKYMKPLTTLEPDPKRIGKFNEVLVKRRRYNLNLTNLTTAQKEKYQEKTHVYQLPKADDFQLFKQDKVPELIARSK